MADVERHDPFGGTYGAALAVGAGEFAFTSVSGVTGMLDGSPVFADTFEEQLRLACRHAIAELARLRFAPADIVDATVFVDPAVKADPGSVLDQLSEHLFGDVAPVLTITRSASLYEASLIIIRITAFKRGR